MSIINVLWAPITTVSGGRSRRTSDPGYQARSRSTIRGRCTPSSKTSARAERRHEQPEVHPHTISHWLPPGEGRYVRNGTTYIPLNRCEQHCVIGPCYRLTQSYSQDSSSSCKPLLCVSTGPYKCASTYIRPHSRRHLAAALMFIICLLWNPEGQWCASLSSLAREATLKGRQ